MKFDKTIKSTIAASLFIAASAQASEGQWRWFPGLDSQYQAQTSLALIGGSADVDLSGQDSDSLYGIEASFNCPLLQTPANRIRQQVSLTRFDADGLDITALEINPHYVVPVADGLEAGFGPGFGAAKVSVAGSDETVLGVQLGASLHYRRGAMFVGAEARYQWTTEENFGAGDIAIDNSRILLKAGVNF